MNCFTVLLIRNDFSQQAMHGIYPCITNGQVVHRNVLFFLQYSFKRLGSSNIEIQHSTGDKKDSNLWEESVELAQYDKLDHVWLRSLMLQYWSVHPRSNNLLYTWISYLKEVVHGFGKFNYPL